MLRSLSAITAAIPGCFLLHGELPEEKLRCSARELPPLGTVVILRTLNGSAVHGVNLSDKEGREEFALAIEPPGSPAWRITERQTGVDTNSRADCWTESLRSFCFRARRGNHTLLVPLFASEDSTIATTELGRELTAKRSMFISRRFGESFRVDIYRCQSHMDKAATHPEANRPEYVSRCKEAADFVRLSYQGLEFMTTGRLSLPMKPEERRQILAIRRGKYSAREVLELGDELFNQFKQTLYNSELPENPDESALEAFVRDAYSHMEPFQA